jgi:hypothetical protein
MELKRCLQAGNAFGARKLEGASWVDEGAMLVRHRSEVLQFPSTFDQATYESLPLVQIDMRCRRPASRISQP